MSIVLPIVFFAVLMGLFVKRMTPGLWTLLIAWIVLDVAYNYVKTPKVTAAGGGAETSSARTSSGGTVAGSDVG